MSVVVFNFKAMSGKRGQDYYDHLKFQIFQFSLDSLIIFTVTDLFSVIH